VFKLHIYDLILSHDFCKVTDIWRNASADDKKDISTHIQFV